MSVFTKSLTNKGIALQAKAQAGSELRYTRFVIGDGRLSGQLLPTMTNVISSKKTIPVTKLKMRSPNEAIIGFTLSNQDVTSGFYFRELGLFAMDPDEGEILYLYANSGETADYIPPAGSDDVIQKSFDTLAFVGQAPNVTANIDHSLVYVTHPELAEAIAGVDIEVPDASLTTKGITQLSSTVSTSESLAATPKLVKSVSDALTTHGNVTTTSVHGSTSAATANRIIQRDANGRAKVAVPAAVDDIARLDTITGQVGTLSSLQTTAKSNVVSALNEVFQSGVNAKQGLVDAINAKGGSASINDSWETLNAKVRAISTTMKFTKITNINQDAPANNGNTYTTPALGFTPKLIEVTMAFNTYFGGNWVGIVSVLTADKLSGAVEYRRGSAGAAYGYFINVTFNANSVTFSVASVNTDLSGTHPTTIRSVCVYGD